MNITILAADGSLLPNDGSNGISILAPDGSWMQPDSTNLVSILDIDGSRQANDGSVPAYSILDLAGNLKPYDAGASKSILAPNGSFRPKRINLLTYTEDFTNAIWIKTGPGVLTPGIQAPDGTMTAFRWAHGTALSEIYQLVGTLAPGSAISIWLKRAAGSDDIRMWNGVSNIVVPVTSEWARVEIDHTTTAGYLSVSISLAGNAVDMWHPQVERSLTATPYQRVDAAHVYGH